MIVNHWPAWPVALATGPNNVEQSVESRQLRGVPCGPQWVFWGSKWRINVIPVGWLLNINVFVLFLFSTNYFSIPILSWFGLCHEWSICLTLNFNQSFGSLSAVCWHGSPICWCHLRCQQHMGPCGVWQWDWQQQMTLASLQCPKYPKSSSV